MEINFRLFMQMHEIMDKYRLWELGCLNEAEADSEAMQLMMKQNPERYKILKSFVDKIIKPDERT